MANTYTQMHVHLVFAVKFRRCLILPAWKAKLHRYIGGIVNQHGHKLLSINGVEDHIHILIGLRPTQALSALVQEIKKSSSKWVNDQKLVIGGFSWQEGFGAFTYGRSAIPKVIRYIENQEAHHQKKSFRQEYTALLKKFDVDFDERYIFQELM